MLDLNYCLQQCTLVIAIILFQNITVKIGKLSTFKVTWSARNAQGYNAFSYEALNCTASCIVYGIGDWSDSDEIDKDSF